MSRVRGVAIVLALLALLTTGCATGAGARRSSSASLAARLSSHRTATATPAIAQRRVITLGRSVQGRLITARVVGRRAGGRRILVIGCIHGNETAGIQVARALVAGPAPPHATLWIVADLNPDGVAGGTRQNAHGVDLNRNFPFAWRLLGKRGDQQYSGPRPLSEPESRIVRRLILRLRPAITIWFHQPEAVTDQSGGSASIERRFAVLSGLPLRRLPRYPGSATGWQDHQLLGTTAFVVELPPGRPRAAAVGRYARAVRGLAASP
jgi:protein MpaA